MPVTVFSVQNKAQIISSSDISQTFGAEAAARSSCGVNPETEKMQQYRVNLPNGASGASSCSRQSVSAGSSEQWHMPSTACAESRATRGILKKGSFFVPPVHQEPVWR